MKIDWTDTAIEAAHNAYWAAEESPTEINEMRAALDAAVAAQGMLMIGDLAYAFESGKIVGLDKARKEAFEEAATVAERLAPDLPDIADAIRQLAENGAKGETP